MDAPDVAMLCALAQHDVALQALRSVGGLHAIAMVAGEGEITAIHALQKGLKEDPSLLLEADTYASIVSLFSPEKKASRTRHDESTGSKVETVAFELLSQLCMTSAKGRKAVSDAHDFQHSANRALEIISKVISSVTDEKKDEDENESEEDVDESDDESGEKVSTENGEDKPSKDEKETIQAVPVSTVVEDENLLAASYSFLSSMTPVRSARDSLLSNEEFIKASSALIGNNDNSNLQFAALRAVSKLTPYSASDGSLSAGNVGELLQAALAAEPKISEKGNLGWNRNLYHMQAVEGALVIFDSLPQSNQEAIFKEVKIRYIKLLKSHSISRATKADERANGGELAFNLTTLMMIARGKDCVAKFYDSNLVSALVNTVQWRYDPKTTIDQASVAYWDATTTQCLQILSQILHQEDSKLVDAGINVRSMKNSVFMVARAGKAPRKAIDFASALKLISINGEAAAKISSQRILAYFENN